MAPTGYYRMHRGWMDNPDLFDRQPYSRREAWCWLIENAAWAPRRQPVSSVVVNLQRGQLAASVRFMASAWGWDEKRVRRFLDRLKTASMIAADTAAGVTLVTICNYEIYQADHEDGAAPPAAANAAGAPQQRRKIEKEKKGKNISDSSLRSESDERAPAEPELALGADDKPGDEPEDVPPPPPEPVEPTEDEQFAEWYAAYPLHKGKGQAIRAYRSALKATSAGQLLLGARRYAQHVSGLPPPERRFVKHPATWLNGRCWEDDDDQGPPGPQEPAGTAPSAGNQPRPRTGSYLGDERRRASMARGLARWMAEREQDPGPLLRPDPDGD